jgi:sodium transport system ATP-binding protein
MREVEKLCHRIAIIYRGQILAIGSIEELSDRYKQPDMEELFFQLIDEHEAELRATVSC